MPNYYTHFYFADKLMTELPYASRSVVDLYPDAYRLGAFGVDILKSLNRLRSKLDYKYIYEFFETTCNYVYHNGSKCQLAYILGMAAHYIADSRINPYIYYILENGVPGYFGADKGFMDIISIRNSIDAHIEKKIPEKQLKSMREEPLGEVVEEIGELFENAVSEVVGYKIKCGKIKNCMSSLKIPAPKPYKLELYDYLNRQKNSWFKVRNTDDTSNMTFMELIDKIIPSAIKVIDNIMSRVRSGEALEKSQFSLNYLGILSQDT